MSKKIELSLDIAMNNLGWVAFEGGRPIRCGVIKPAVPKELLCQKGSKSLSIRQQNVILIEQLVEGLDQILKTTCPAFVTGEATPGGAKNASAAVKLNMALTAVVAACLLNQVQYQWCTPNQVKKATAGKSDATKEQIMDWAIGKYGGDKKVVEVQIKNGKRAGAIDRRLTYQFLGEWIPGGSFEHIADACGAYEVLQFQPTGKIGAKGYRNKPKRLGK